MEKLEFVKKDGLICEAVATYHHDENNKDYILYTDHTYDKDNHLKIYYSLYKKHDDDIELIEIKDLEDERIALEFLKEVLKELNKK